MYQLPAKMAAVTICNETSVSDLKTRLRHIYRVIESYRWIIEAYLSDFYVKEHWSRLPVSWQQYLGQLDFPHLSKLLTGQLLCQPTTPCSVSPLSLLALKACCEHLSLNRRCVDIDNPHVIACVSNTLKGGDGGISLHRLEEDHIGPCCPEMWTDKALGFKNGQLMEMEHIFRKHVKPKKQHEIWQLGKVIDMVSEQAGSQHVVDVGAGLGHLSRLLTFAYGLKVTTVEATGGHAPKASEFDRELKKDIQKKLKKHDPSTSQDTATIVSTPDLPYHVVCTVRPDITTDQFLRLVVDRNPGTEGAGEDMDLFSGNRTQVPPASANSAPLSMECQPSGSAKVNASVTVDDSSELKQCKTAIAPQSVGQSAGVLLERVETAAALPSGDSVTVADGAAGTRCCGESAAKISRYDGEEESRTGNDRAEHVSLSTQGCASHLSPSPVYASTNQNLPLPKSTGEPSLVVKTSHDQIGGSSPVTQTLNGCDGSDRSEGAGTERQTEDSGTWSCCEACDEAMCSDRKPSLREETGRCVRCRVGDVDAGGKTSASQERGGVEKRAGEPRDAMNGLVLAGLHACGDLTATLLRVFVTCPAVSALVSVACCYMKLSAYSCDDDRQSERGYPMSQFVQSLPAHPLTYEAREMACHFADAYAQRLLESPPHLKIHSYRAAVQYVLTETWPGFRHPATRLVVKKGAEVPFPQYASQCLRRLGIDPSEVSDIVMTTAESLTAEWHRVVAFYTLRLSLAPLVETAILLDRMLFLYEHGLPSVVLPVFDSTLSPRNFALLACRPA